MSEHPLTPTNMTIVIACSSINQANDAMAQYGTDAAGVVAHKCVTVADALAAVALPALTPWCILAHADELVIAALGNRFGVPRNLSNCLDMHSNDYAIRPSRFV